MLVSSHVAIRTISKKLQVRLYTCLLIQKSYLLVLSIIGGTLFKSSTIKHTALKQHTEGLNYNNLQRRRWQSWAKI